jgi:hypothetical protein
VVSLMRPDAGRCFAAPQKGSHVTESRYQRSQGCAFRALHRRLWVGGPSRSTVVLEGSVVLVWLALDTPSTLHEMAERIGQAWPSLNDVQLSEIQEALDLLYSHRLVEIAGLEAEGDRG